MKPFLHALQMVPIKLFAAFFSINSVMDEFNFLVSNGFKFKISSA